MNFYDVLEVEPDASTSEIRRAFRERARRYHPDVNEHPDAGEQFRVLKAARDVLVDDAERTAYDRLGHGGYLRERMDSDLPSVEMDPSPVGEPAAGFDDADVGGAPRGDDTPGSAPGRSGTVGSSDAAADAGGTDGTGSAADGSPARGRGAEGSATEGSVAPDDAPTPPGASGAGESLGSRTVGADPDGQTSAGAATGGSTDRAAGGSAGRATGAGSGRGGVGDGTAGRGGSGATDGSVAGNGRTPDPTPTAARRRRQVRADAAGHLEASRRWLGVVGAAVVYGLGLGSYLRASRPGLGTALTGLVSGDVTGLGRVLAGSSQGVGGPLTFVEGAPLLAGSLPTAGGVLLGGAVLLPAAMGVAVAGLRRKTTWNPTWLNVVGTLGPAAALGVEFLVARGLLADASVPGWLDLLLLAAVPGLTVFAFLLNRVVLVLPLRRRDDLVDPGPGP